MSADPKVAVRTHREKRVSLTWPDGDGPLVDVARTANGGVSLTYILVRQEQGKEPYIFSARGLHLKKDGTVGTRSATLYTNNLNKLPDDVRGAALAALKGVAW